VRMMPQQIQMLFRFVSLCVQNKGVEEFSRHNLLLVALRFCCVVQRCSFVFKGRVPMRPGYRNSLIKVMLGVPTGSDETQRDTSYMKTSC
jgi:hypothetical protein